MWRGLSPEEFRDVQKASGLVGGDGLSVEQKRKRFIHRDDFIQDFYFAPVSPVSIVTASTLLNVYVFSQENRTDHLQRMRVHQAVVVRSSPIPRPDRAKAPLVVIARKNRITRILGRQTAYVNRPPWTGVPRAKTVKGIYVHMVERADDVVRRANGRSVIVRPGVGVARPAQALTRSVAKRSVFRSKRRRREPLILRSPLFARAKLSTFVRSVTRRTPPRTKIERHRAFIFKAPVFVTGVVTAETIKHVYVRSVSRVRQQQRRLAKSSEIITRPAAVLGVRREKTVKAIFVHGVGRGEQLAKRRRHAAKILKAGLLVTTPTGRISLHPVDRSKSFKLRRARLAFVFRSRGGVAVVVSQKTIHAIFVHPTTWSQRLEARLRRHKARVSRAPITVTGGKSLVHSVERAPAGKLRRHRLFFFRSTQIGVARARTTKPIYVRVLHKRQIALLRHHIPRILRSRGGQALSDVSFIEPFDQPTPTGRTGSLPTHTDYDFPGPLGRISSAPSEGAFDIPAPIGVVSIPDPEV